jgi:SAM-dependent methyltransferase
MSGTGTGNSLEPTAAEFRAKAEAISAEAGVSESFHAYFVQHNERLFNTCRIFDLFRRNLGDTLEIGPFYGYTPFILRPNAASYCVLEGDDPAAYPLKEVYQKYGITAEFVDLFDSFGSIDQSSPALNFPSESFDSLLCWETMEHFNFNPVPFVREIFRLLRPGGRAFITVPNRASLQNIVTLVGGFSEIKNVAAYYTYENYFSHGRKVFYGFHWREYSAAELAYLFRHAGFTVRTSGTFVAFQARPHLTASRKIMRSAVRAFAAVFPRYGTNAYLVAEK